MSNTEPFGGISILAVGDLLQLPAVAQKPIFATPSDEMSAIYGSIWQTHFKIIELTEIQRQKNDSRFASLLNRVRIGGQSDEDIALLNTRVVLPTADNFPTTATHIFAYNKDVSEHNATMLQTLPGPLYTFTAKDSKRDEQTKRVDVSAFADNAGGLFKTLVLGVGARVIITKNMDVTDGLVNSAAGVVTGFLPPPEDDIQQDFLPKFVLVKFDDEKVGQKRRLELRTVLTDRYEGSTPIPQVEVPFTIGKSSKITSKRTQFPLTHAWAITIHKEQGKTEDVLVLSVKGSFNPGQFYTAISRTKTLEGLFIIDKIETSKVKVNRNSLKEIERMTQDALFLPTIPIALERTSDYFLKINFLNINSLIPHFPSLMKDHYIQQAQLTTLVETWLTPSDNILDIANYNHHRCDLTPELQQNRRRRSGGMLMFIHDDLYFMKEYKVEDVKLEYQMVIFAFAENPRVRFVCLSVYNNPSNNIQLFLCSMERLLCEIPTTVKAIIVGDFNIDILQSTNSANKLQNLMRYYGFHQLCHTPTHRRGGLLDHCYTNIIPEYVDLSIIPTYNSDHHLLCAAIPFHVFA